MASAPPIIAQQSAHAPAEKPAKPELPFQIQLLETHIRFESNGDSRKEVHTIVKINNILGVHEFARLAFDYNRSFQQVEIPQIRISLANGGTSEVLPSAVADSPNPTVEPYPAYHDVRVKSVRILGLQEGDTIEYRVITTTTHHPLAPDFWLEHTFDRSGQVLHETYDLNLPAARFEQPPSGIWPPAELQSWPPDCPSAPDWAKSLSVGFYCPTIGTIYVSPATPQRLKESFNEGKDKRLHLTWEFASGDIKKPSNSASGEISDVVVTTYARWEGVAWGLSALFYPWWRGQGPDETIRQKGKELLGVKNRGTVSLEESVYDFVSEKIATIDLPLSSTGYKARPPAEVLRTGYGTALDKASLFVALINYVRGSGAQCALVPDSPAYQMLQMPRPSLFSQPIVRILINGRRTYADPSLGVAPFGLIRSGFRGKDVFIFRPPEDSGARPDEYFSWEKVPVDLPFPAFQKVAVEAAISLEGALLAKVKYTMRGDNELVLRTAFHQTPREKWKEVANLLALSDGFRGQITNVTASDPLETKDPFTVEYELTQPKFVDWSKTPVRIPALLPQISMPDAPPAAAAGQPPLPIELGTPLEVQTTMTLHLPAGTTIETPPGTSVTRDYATFTSKYSATQNTVTASRHINFLLRELPADRAIDYNAFLHAVQNDQVQRFTVAAPKQ